MYIFLQFFKYVSFRILCTLKLSLLLLYYLFHYYCSWTECLFLGLNLIVCLGTSMIMLFFLGKNIPEKYDFYVSYYSVI